MISSTPLDVLKIGIAVVNYKKSLDVVSLLRQLSLQQCVHLEIAIVDNSGELAEFLDPCLSRVFVISPGVNLGYGVGVNSAISSLSSVGVDIFLVLSPDIQLLANAPTFLRDFCSSYLEIAPLTLMGISQLNPDGTYEPVARRFPDPLAQISRKLGIFSLGGFAKKYLYSYDCAFMPDSALLPVDWLQSSFLAFTPSTWSMLDGFDPRYYVFMADVDLCRKARMIGIPSLLNRNFCVGADGVRATSAGVGGVFFSRVGRIHIKDALIYYWHWFILSLYAAVR